MRILMYSESLKREGGTEISSLQIARALSERGHSVDLLYEVDGQLRTEYLAFCRSVTKSWMTLDKRSLRDAAGLIPAVWSGIQRRPDVIYVHRFRDVVCARPTGLATGAPVVCHLRDAFHDGTTRRLGRWADRFIAVSRATRDSWVNDGLDPSRVDVVHTGIDPTRYPAGGQHERRQARRAMGLPPNGFVALYYGRMDADKGIDLLLDAWQLLGMSADDGCLVLQGHPVLAPDPDGYLRYLRQRAPQGCRWLPMSNDVTTVLHAADVVVLPSVTEGLSRTAMEGMASGRPVVATRVGGVPEILTGPFERFLFESGDATGLARQLVNLVDWRRREAQLGVACSEHIRVHFSLPRMAEGVEGVFRNEIDNRSKTRPALPWRAQPRRPIPFRLGTRTGGRASLLVREPLFRRWPRVYVPDEEHERRRGVGAAPAAHGRGREVTMYTRLLNFTGATDIDGGVAYLRDEVLPVLNAQHGYRGVTASADRAGRLLGILSLWESESDRAASDSALGKARQEAVKIAGGTLTVENYEQVVAEVKKPPAVGCSLIVTRLSMDPASVDDNIAFFKNDIVPQITAQPGFCALRNMVDRQTGRGVVGTVWEDREAMEAYDAGMAERRAPAASRGITFDETTYREILLADMK
jgi:glycosyltransferase involved in cell wall biosynthesis/heme-degrading monooxygenase HmoA